MNKKIISSLFILTTAVNVAFADSKSYVGASIGVTDLGYNQVDGVTTGAIGKVFGGRGFNFGENLKYYLGGELDFDVASYKHFNTNYAMGVSVLPGFMITPSTMIYGRLGLQANRFSNSNNTSFGDQLGFGVQTKISKNVDFRAEYISVSNVTNQRDNQLLAGFVYKFS